MLWRAWSFAAGVPPGLLAAWALVGPGSLLALQIGAAAGGGLLLLVASILARARDDDPERGVHLAVGASAGWLALPALAACLLHLAPGPVWLLGGVLLCLALALYRGALRHGPSGGLRRALLLALAHLGAGSLAVVGVASLLASWTDEPLAPDERRAAAVYDTDARVVTREIPRCESRPASSRVLLERGARPAVDGRFIWLDADVEGRRQVQRLDRESGEVVCWTCGEAGNNQRPRPGGSRLLFETDRHATWWDPTNTEIHLASSRGDAPGGPSRRLTYSAGPDDHALFAPAPGLVVWSQRRDGGYAVVSASLRSAHGGLMLGTPGVLVTGGASWTAPLAWSPDARSLAVVRGNPLRPLDVRGVDFATGRSTRLGAAAAGGSSASFSADGSWVVLAEARRSRVAGLLPRRLGFLLAPYAARLERARPLFRETGLRTGEARGKGGALALGDLAQWGAPTGVALLRDEPVIILGQRRQNGSDPEERLVEIALDCHAPARGGSGPGPERP